MLKSLALMSLLCALAAQEGGRPQPSFLSTAVLIEGGAPTLVDKIRAATLVIDGVPLDLRSATIGEALDGRFVNLKVLLINTDAVVRPNGGLDIPQESRRADSLALVVAAPAAGISTDVAKNDVADLLGGRLNPIGYAVVTMDAVEAKEKVRSIVVGVRSLKAGGTDGDSPGAIAQRLALGIAQAVMIPR